MRTRPLSIRYMVSPASPARKSVVSKLTFWVRSRLRRSTAAPSSSEENSGTDRIASSVISWGVGVDMGYLSVVSDRWSVVVGRQKHGATKLTTDYLPLTLP